MSNDRHPTLRRRGSDGSFRSVPMSEISNPQRNRSSSVSHSSQRSPFMDAISVRANDPHNRNALLRGAAESGLGFIPVVGPIVRVATAARDFANDVASTAMSLRNREGARAAASATSAVTRIVDAGAAVLHLPTFGSTTAVRTAASRGVGKIKTD